MSKYEELEAEERAAAAVVEEAGRKFDELRESEDLEARRQAAREFEASKAKWFQIQGELTQLAIDRLKPKHPPS